MSDHNQITSTAITEYRTREFNRFIDGTYDDLPQQVYNALTVAGISLEPLHYVHISMEQPGMIAYTENAAKGCLDRQTRVKFGRYLARFHGTDATEAQIAKLAALLRGKVSDLSLKFARTREEIAHVYEHGPHSCMSGPASRSDFNCGPHQPAEVYGGGDTAVAYMERDGRITARIITNEIAKEYTTAYGDADNLIELLREAGYTHGDLEGCKLLYLENNNGYVVCPYLDGAADMVTMVDDWLLVGYEGEWQGACNTNGLLDEDAEDPEFCPCCSESGFGFSDMHMTSYGDYICGECLHNYYSYASDSGEYVPSDSPDHVYLEGPDVFVHTDSLAVYGYCFDFYDSELRAITDCVELHTGDFTDPDNAVHCEIDDCYALLDDTEEYETEDGEVKYTIDSPDSDPDYRIADMFADEKQEAKDQAA